jgi:hypothetical protein
MVKNFIQDLFYVEKKKHPTAGKKKKTNLASSNFGKVN